MKPPKTPVFPRLPFLTAAADDTATRPVAPEPIRERTIGPAKQGVTYMPRGHAEELNPVTRVAPGDVVDAVLPVRSAARMGYEAAQKAHQGDAVGAAISTLAAAPFVLPGAILERGAAKVATRASARAAKAKAMLERGQRVDAKFRSQGIQRIADAHFAPPPSSADAAMLRNMQESGFAGGKMAAMVELPIAGAGRGGSTATAMAEAVKKIGRPELRRLAEENLAARGVATPEATMAATEEVARRVASGAPHQPPRFNMPTGIEMAEGEKAAREAARHFGWDEEEAVQLYRTNATRRGPSAPPPPAALLRVK